MGERQPERGIAPFGEFSSNSWHLDCFSHSITIDVFYNSAKSWQADVFVSFWLKGMLTFWGWRCFLI